jgi:1A family penicillin-binding protein
MKERRKNSRQRNYILAAVTAVLFVFGISFVWVASLRIPAMDDLSERRVSSSTKIYDRTGEILLYDLSQDVRRNVIPLSDISPHIQEATIAIEDKDFYNHYGIKISSFFRAVLVNLSTLSYSQGGSTITQQVVKNSILTKDKTPTRKIKEWILAAKLEKVLTKDEILNFYLNEIPYGGNIYGVEEASKNFFGRSAKDVTIAEAAYLAALPKAPTFYSPYGQNRERLDERKNTVLREMLSMDFITEEEYNAAKEEKVEFKPRQRTGSLKAPHFVFFVIDYLAERYGEEAVQNGGFRVITTLDYEIQEAAEEIAKKYGTINEERFKGENNATVVIDPKNGEILALVGSRDYFDDTIEGNFNVATAHRQPGSAFKPIVYANLFTKGYTPETILFDVPTQFSTNCSPDNLTSDNGCYSPNNYDNAFRGPVTVRAALAQSLNIPAVKALYLAGIKSSIDFAKEMGIEGLDDRNRFGLSLVLGGGEVSLLDLTSAYSVFANDGVRSPYNPIIRVESGSGEIIEQITNLPKRVVPAEAARNISSILSDNNARAPLYGTASPLYFGGRDVAVKTGTTNDYRDAWIIGYTPNVTVGTWAGNNDNSSMERKVSGLIVAPMWRELMDKILPMIPNESFIPPQVETEALKPVLRGEWRGGASTPVLDAFGQVTGEQVNVNIHNILYWVDRNNPRGPAPSNPASDPQFNNWEHAVRRWAMSNGYGGGNVFVPRPDYNPANPYSPYAPQTPVTPTYPYPYQDPGVTYPAPVTQ